MQDELGEKLDSKNIERDAVCMFEVPADHQRTSARATAQSGSGDSEGEETETKADVIKVKADEALAVVILGTSGGQVNIADIAQDPVIQEGRKLGRPSKNPWLSEPLSDCRGAGSLARPEAPNFEDRADYPRRRSLSERQEDLVKVHDRKKKADEVKNDFDAAMDFLESSTLVVVDKVASADGEIEDAGAGVVGAPDADDEVMAVMARDEAVLAQGAGDVAVASASPNPPSSHRILPEIVGAPGEKPQIHASADGPWARNEECDSSARGTPGVNLVTPIAPPDADNPPIQLRSAPAPVPNVPVKSPSPDPMLVAAENPHIKSRLAPAPVPHNPVGSPSPNSELVAVEALQLIANPGLETGAFSQIQPERVAEVEAEKLAYIADSKVRDLEYQVLFAKAKMHGAGLDQGEPNEAMNFLVPLGSNSTVWGAHDKAFSPVFSAMITFRAVLEAQVLRVFIALCGDAENSPLRVAQLLCFLRKLRPGGAENSVEYPPFQVNCCDATRLGLEENCFPPLPEELHSRADASQRIVWDFFCGGMLSTA